jgi:L-threonylcarbamoyladenylate synthase
MNVINTELALDKLKSGLPIIFQTDTLPAIGCLPEFSQIIYDIKKRDSNKPLILMGAENEQLIDYVHESAKEDYENLAAKYWPGALTMIIPVSENKKSTVTSKNFTLGLRIPNSHIAQSLIRETGPLLTSSANISGIQGSITAEGISLDLPNVDILGPLPWERCSGKASTIISWVKYRDWNLIRKGQVSINGFY